MAVDRGTPTGTDLNGLDAPDYATAVNEEIRALWDSGSLIALTGVTGTNALGATCTPAFVAGYATGMQFTLTAPATNTGANCMPVA